MLCVRRNVHRNARVSALHDADWAAPKDTHLFQRTLHLNITLRKRRELVTGLAGVSVNALMLEPAANFCRRHRPCKVDGHTVANVTFTTVLSSASDGFNGHATVTQQSGCSASSRATSRRTDGSTRGSSPWRFTTRSRSSAFAASATRSEPVAHTPVITQSKPAARTTASMA